MSNLSEVITRLNATPDARTFFGPDKLEARKAYRALAKVLHPDHGGDTDAFQKLERLYDEYTGKITVSSAPITIVTKKATYVVGEQIATGDIATLYRASYQTDNTTKTVTMKVVRNPQNNDLAENEAASLRKIESDGDKEMASFVSMMLDSFRQKDGTGIIRQTNVFEPLDGWYSLSDVQRIFPDGLDAKDAAWIWRRLLFAIGYAHSAGVVHGAVVPEHVMIEPEQHGLMLVDWCYSKVEPFGPLTAIVPQRRDMYPREVVVDKKTVSHSTDIYMATRTMESMLDANAPLQIRAFIRGCTVGSVTNAWKLREEFDELIERLWGPRRFRPMVLPSMSAV